MKSLLSAFLLAATPLGALAEYELVKEWPAMAKDQEPGICAGVAVDAQNRVFVFHRGARVWKTPFPEEPIGAAVVLMLDGPTGKLIGQWGADQFIMPHGLTVDGKGNLWLTDVGLHQVFKFTPDGQLLMTLGERRVPGADQAHFNLPTDVAVLADGSFYVSDGYKNTRVVKFHADGRYDFEWGGKGSASGQFNLPHGIAIGGDGQVYVCDRENLRLQVFDPQGKFLAQWQGPKIGKPYGVELGPKGHLFIVDGGMPKVRAEERGKAVELDASGKVVDNFGTGEFQLGHDIAVGPDGAVYVADATGRKVRKFVKASVNR
jgi:peptidylamidoglycolate lyase